MTDTTMALVISGWDLVKASRGARDHATMVEGFMDSIKSAQEREDKGCTGSVESAELLFEASILNAEVQVKNRGPASDYEAIMNAGNAWFDAVGLHQTPLHHERDGPDCLILQRDRRLI